MEQIPAYAHFDNTAAVQAIRYVSFYNQLTRNQDPGKTVPFTMSSPLARRHAHLLKKMFGTSTAINPAAVLAAVNRHPTILFNTQNFIQMMATAVKLLGFLVWSELKVVMPADSSYLRTHPLFVYLLWNSFVIHELFDAISGRVYHNKVLSHDTVCLGNIQWTKFYVVFVFF